jgi:hypothetical protein
MSAVITLSCGWCPTPLPDDREEVEHHFLVQHNVSDGTSVRYHCAYELPQELQLMELDLVDPREDGTR